MTDLKTLPLFELLEKRRRHVVSYKDNVHPDKKLIDEALYKAWKSTPSKNNMMAYRCDVYGPDKVEEKKKMWKLCNRNHRETDINSNADGVSNVTLNAEESPNPYYGHIWSNSYLFLIQSRLATPNKYYQHAIDNGEHIADEEHERYVHRIIDHTCLEAGLFASNLSAGLLANDIDISYNICFVRRKEDWTELGIDMMHRPLLMMTAGYARRYRWQDMRDKNCEEYDIKPEQDTIIHWK